MSWDAWNADRGSDRLAAGRAAAFGRGKRQIIGEPAYRCAFPGRERAPAGCRAAPADRSGRRPPV
ncbi:hypothetical protein D9X30_5617 [Cupriavidus sp. U2]|nr:hypothetical protein D9X30_5617 [Cupriavidus sp. U2]